MSQPAPNPPCPTTQRERQPYAPPRLVVHGSAAKLTANLDAGATDGKGGSHLDP